ncbi:MAG: DinB family protein [Dehalococcoidia bacterium]
MKAAELTERLERSRASLMEAIAGMDEEGFRRRTASGEWCAAEALAHLLAHEQRFMWLTREALAKDNPPVQSRGEGQQIEEAKAAQRMLVPQIVHGLLAQRRETLQLLAGLSPEQLVRSLVHSRLGEVDAGWLFQRIVDHETEHAAQIASIRVETAGTPAT